MTRRRRFGPLGGSVLLVVFAAGCDSGPQGPGSLTATVQGPFALGAGVLEVYGKGVTGFEGSGSTRVFSVPLGPDAYRVVVVAETPGQLPFEVVVQDPENDRPGLTLISAVDGANRVLSGLGEYTIRLDQ